jgi:hypothetical protein
MKLLQEQEAETNTSRRRDDELISVQKPGKRPSIMLSYAKTRSKRLSTDIPRWMTLNQETGY